MTINTTTTNKHSATITVHDGLNHTDPGLAHIHKPHVLTLEQERDLIQEARRRRTELLTSDATSDDWYSRVTYHGVTVTSKREPDNPFCITKGYTQAPVGMTLQDVCRQFASDFQSPNHVLRTFHLIDPMNRHMTTISELQHREELEMEETENLRILWGSFYVAPLVSDRDFLFVMHTSITTCPVTHQQVFLSNSFSTELPDAVPDLQQQVGYVRARIQMTGYIFRPLVTTSDDNDTNDTTTRLSMAFVGQCDPRGYLPSTVVNVASVSQALNAGRVRDSYQHYCHVNQVMNFVQYQPICCHQVPRRGGSVLHQIPLVLDTRDKANQESRGLSLRLRAHCDHVITVEWVPPQSVTTNTDNDDENQHPSFTLELDDVKDPMGTDLLQGKPVTFGGKAHPVLDITFQVTLLQSPSQDQPCSLDLVFKNHGWKKAILCLPNTMEISSVDGTVEARNQ